MNTKIFTNDDQKEQAQKLLIEFDEKVKQLLGSKYYVDILKSSSNPNPTPGTLQDIYPHFCETIPYSKDLQKCIEGTINSLYDPNLSADEAKKPGLLLGKIQSGKTRAFVGCMALAFDRGVDACIILTKGTNALIEQTVKRMKYDFRECKRDARPKRFATVSIYDIMKKRSGLKKSLINKEKNVFVAKKEDDNMQALIDVFLSDDFKNKNILIIDDEADFVSRSFIKKNKDVTEGVIASMIDELIEGLPNCRYLQVTATPYSLYMQPNDYVDVANGKVTPFRPRFTAVVPVHNKYIGSTEYFVKSQNDDSMYSFLHFEVSQECIVRLSASRNAPSGKKIKRGALLKNIAANKQMEDFRWAIMHYFVASAIRELQEEALGHDCYHTSFIMHVGTNKVDQEWEADLTDALLNAWSEALAGPANDQNAFLDLFDKVYANLKDSMAAGKSDPDLAKKKEKIMDIVDKKLVLERVMELLLNDEYNVQLVNSDQDMLSLLDDEGQLELTHPLNLFIGGFVLDRGITIGHLLGFFYGREPQRKQQASMLQHCRMYGSRSLNDMAVTRLYSQQSLYDALKKVNDMDDEMRARFMKTINDPKADPSIEFVICDKKNGIVPCGPSATALSGSLLWKGNQFVLPVGHQTITSSSRLDEIVDKIKSKLKGQRERICFELDAKTAIEMVKLARQQYQYSGAWNNLDHKWNEEEMIFLINRFKDKKGKILGYTRTGCDTGRIRKKGVHAGRFIDAPIDGQVESPYVKAQAVDRPVLLMLLEKGNKTKDWLGSPFYWPVLCLPQKMDDIAYCPR